MKIMNLRRDAIILLYIAIIVSITIDYIAKVYAANLLRCGDSIYLFSEHIRLVYAENQGAFLSLGASLNDHARSLIFTVLVALVLVVWLFYLTFTVQKKASVLPLALLIGGGFGNLLSRLLNEGKVIDFMQIDLGFAATGIFNVADIFICIGLSILLVRHFRPNKTNSSETDTI